MGNTEEVKKIYRLKPETKVSFLSKLRMQQQAKKIKKQKLHKYEMTRKEREKEAAKVVAQNEKELLQIEKAKLKEQKQKEKEAKKIAKQIAKERKEKDKRLLKEAEAHQRELKKAFEKETKEENKRIALSRKDEENRLKQQEKIRSTQRDKMDEENRTRRHLANNKDKEYKEYMRATAKQRAEEARRKDKEFKEQKRVLEEIRKNEEELEKDRQQKAGITKGKLFSEKLRRFLRFYSYKNLQQTVNSYGYSYSLTEFALSSGSIIAVILIVSIISQLKGGYLVAIVAVTVLSIPFLLYGYFKQLYSTKRFEMVQSYLSNIIPIFIQKPKFRYAAEEVSDMSEDQMKNVLNHAIDYIDTNTDDENVDKTAMEFIELEFPNSRIKSVHKLMTDIEHGNSETYVNICENMYIDIEGWIRRVYNFQKELKSRRTSLLMLCGFSVLLNTVFVYMYGTSEIFDGFTDKALYQISTFIFILAIFLTAALIIIKLNGGWLVDDAKQKNEDEKIKDYNYIHTHDGSLKTKDAIMAVIIGIACLVVAFANGQKAALGGLVVSGILLFKDKMTLNSKKKSVAKALMVEFPVWLRGVALDLNDMTVVVSMEKSMETCSYLMKKELEKFFEEYNQNPTSIAAFNNFLREHQIEDVQSSMKILYTIQSMSKEDTNNQVTIIIQRNQELLAKTEQLQNEESIGAAELLGYMPMILLTSQLIISMVLLFSHVMNYMNEITSTIG